MSAKRERCIQLYAGGHKKTDRLTEMLSDPRSLEQALADLIERRESNALRRDQQALVDRMIVDLEAEIERRRSLREERLTRRRA